MGEIETGNASHQNETDKAPDQKCYIKLDNSLYQAAASGNVEAFEQHENHLHKLLTPNENSILHIHITARPKHRIKYFGFFWKKHRSKDWSEDLVGWVGSKCQHLLWTPNKNGDTPLHVAARHNHSDVVSYLIGRLRNLDSLESGVLEIIRGKLAAKNADGDTALHEAVRCNHIDIVLLLLDAHDKFKVPLAANNADETPLYLAAERGYVVIVSAILIYFQSPPHQGPNGRTALHAAVIRNDTETIEWLLAEKSLPTMEPDKQGWIPLHYAAYNGYLQIVRLLLDKDHENKSSAYKTISNGMVAVHLAAENGHVEIIKELISTCPCCGELVDDRGWNILHFAVKSENESAVKYILSNPWLKNLINEKNKQGETPLHQLARSGISMSSFITHHKVDKLAFNNRNLTALDIIAYDKEQLWGRRKKVERHLKRFVHGTTLRTVSLTIEPEGNNMYVAEGNDRNTKDAGDSPTGNKDRTKDIMEYIKDAREAHLVVATLIATVAFTAGLTMPGGHEDDGYEAGAPILAGRRAFQAFIVADTMAMLLSCLAIFIHLFMALERDKAAIYILFNIASKSTIGAMFAMMVAFITGTYAVLFRHPRLSISAAVLCGLFFLICFCIPLDWKGLPDKTGKNPSPSRHNMKSKRKRMKSRFEIIRNRSVEI